MLPLIAVGIAAGAAVLLQGCAGRRVPGQRLEKDQVRGEGVGATREEATKDAERQASLQIAEKWEGCSHAGAVVTRQISCIYRDYWKVVPHKCTAIFRVDPKKITCSSPKK